ncbi:PUA domain-containing protein [Halobellus litoreus]|uniref:PUA domain-containing protein n=1 Tax=Halobellus litoreus TaxID=755310 RepID=A0ABD6DT02_9EURY|nr:PUA domain-containing protein [Halobellus litoreus]
MSEADGDGETMAELRTIAEYQFGAGAGEALFPSDSGESLTVHRSTSGRPRQIVAPGGRIVSYGTDGRFTLGVAGGRRLVDALDRPTARVVVGEESEPFVRDGKNAFAKFVRAVDPDVRPGDEVAVVRGDDTVIAVGRAELSADAMADFETGMAVHVRDGAGDEKKTDD